MTVEALGAIQQTAITTAISIAANGAAWFLFRRAIERQDASLREQADEIRDLREQKIARLETDIAAAAAAGAAGRKALHEKLETDFVRRIDCGQRMDDGANRMDRIETTIRENGVILSEVDRKTEGVASVVRLIAQNLGIHLRE